MEESVNSQSSAFSIERLGHPQSTACLPVQAQMSAMPLAIVHRPQMSQWERIETIVPRQFKTAAGLSTKPRF